MITEDYCSYEVAKLLKEKGFEIDTNKDYWKIREDGIMYFMSSIGAYSSNSNDVYAIYRPENSYPCPTHQMAMKWLRDEKNVLIYVYPVINLPVKDDNTLFHWRWDGKRKIHSAPHIGDKHNYESYEEAVETALKYSLKNLI